MKPDTVVRNTTAEIVIEKILDWLETGKINVGDRLPPAPELARIFGVGRSSIREAVRALGVMGYLDILPGKGTFVKKTAASDAPGADGLMAVLGSAQIFDIMEARDWLEFQCARTAAERADPDQIKKLEQAVADMESHKNDTEGLIKADFRFHLALAEAANNEVVYEIMKLIVSKVESNAAVFYATLPGAQEKSIVTARQVLAHIVSGEGQKAAQSIRSHIAMVRRQLQNVITHQRPV